MPATSTHYIRSLQSMRFIFIFLILLSHFSFAGLGPFDFGGDSGVCFFFILSGFVLSLGDNKKPGRSLPFFTKRLKRVYPAHLLALVMAAVCIPAAFDTPEKIISSLSLTQSWWPGREIYFGGNGPAWFLSNTVAFYLVFPWLKHILFKARWLVIITGTAITLTVYFTVIAPVVPEDKVNWLLYVFPPSRLIDFCQGIILARLYMLAAAREYSLSAQTSTIIEYCAICLIIASSWIYPILPERYATTALFWIPCAALIFCFALTDRHPGLPGRILQHRAMLWLGGISFEFFLVHVSVIQLFKRVTWHYSIGLPYPAALAAVFLLSIGATVAVRHIIKYIQTKKH